MLTMDGLLFEKHRDLIELEAGIDAVLASPKDKGLLKLITVRPRQGARQVLAEAVLDTDVGLVGDNWSTRGSGWRGMKAANPDAQITVMNYRFALFIAGTPERVPLAGDQLFVDLDLSPDNLPPGTRLLIGSSVIEVSAAPHLGCKKFVERFGIEAMKFANSDFGRSHNLRGINAKVITGGEVTTGDTIYKHSVDK
jgi:hypothetical protein